MSNGPTPPSVLPTVTGTRRSSTRAIDTERIDRYFLLERLGEGGMGVVVSAYDPELDRRVAIKLLQSPKDARGRLRLLREAQAMAKLSHPNVVQVYDAGTAGGRVYLAMELVAGQNARAWLKAEPRSWREIVRVFVAAGRGLAAAHDHGIVHRDFKPDNVLVGSDGRVRVADFGIAALDVLAEPPAAPTSGGTNWLANPITATGGIVGTPRYMAPEQHAALPVGPAADQFSFCVALHEALFGERPFGGDTLPELVENVAQERYRAPADPTRAPRWLVEVVRRGLRPDPELRHPSLAALLDRLEDDPAVRRSRRLRYGAATLVVGSALGLAAWSWSENVAQACSAGREAMASLWNDDARARVRDAFERADDPATDAVLQTLDGWTEGWVQSRVGMCAAHRDGTVSQSLYDTSVACSARQQRAFERLLELASDARGPALERLASAATKLPRVTDCSDLDALARDVRPPPDSEQAARVDALRERLAAAEVTHDAGEHVAATTELDAIATEAEALDYDPLTAEVSLVIGRLALERSDYAIAHEELPRASSRALASGLDLVAAEAETRRVFLDAVATVRPTAALDRVPLAAALVERVGDPPWLRAMMSNNVGAAHALLRDRERAEVELATAFELAESSDTVDPIEHAAYASNLARLTADPARRDELFLRAEAIVTEAVGPGHADRLDHAIGRARHTIDPVAAAQLLAPACRQLDARALSDVADRHACWARLAELYEELDDAAQALEAARSAAAAFETEASLSPPHVAMRSMANAYVAVLQAEPDRALEELAHAEEILAPHRDLPWVAVLLADVTLLRGRALDHLGRLDEAVPALRDALETYEQEKKAMEDRAAHLRSKRVRALLESAENYP